MRHLTEQDRKILKQRFIRAIYEGEPLREILLGLNVSLNTVKNWKANDPRFVKGIERAYAERAKSAVIYGLDQLASGYTETTEHTEWIEENEHGEMRKRRRVEKQVAPNLNALMKLANKYAPNEYESDSDSSQVTIRITQKDRSLTIEERRRILDAERTTNNQGVIDVDASDIRELESLELVPPTKDQDEDSGG